jgi:ABC-type Na+ efflux pump permease subunit
MNKQQIKTIVKKELKEIITDKGLIFSLVVLPIVLLVVIPLVFFVVGLDETAVKSLSLIVDLSKDYITDYVPNTIQIEQTPMYLIYRYIFPPFTLLIPVMLSNVLASYSFVGEKEKRTLEGLLYTPITQQSLIMGKILAALLPSVLVTWFFSLIYSIIANIAGMILFNELIFPNMEWFLLILFLVPAITFLSIALVILISQRMKSSKSSQSVSLVIVIPLMGVIITQAVGALFIDAKILFILFVVVILLDFIIFRLAAKRFNKEKYILNM